MTVSVNPSALPGYETTFLTRTDISDEGFKALQERLKQVISRFQGEIVLTEDWGKRKLAYPIQNETRAQYTYLVYNGQPGIVAELERNLRLNEQILRYLTVQIGEDFHPNEFRKQRAAVHAATKRREEEREARRDERNHDRRGGYEDREQKHPYLDDLADDLPGHDLDEE